MRAVLQSDGTLANGRRDRVFVAPASIDSVSKSCFRNSEFSGPFRNAFGFSVVGNQAVVSPVSVLLLMSGPPTIAGLVIAILIWETIYAVILGRAWPHIGYEIIKGIFPAFADGNAASAVKRIVGVCFQQASFLEASPAAILARKTAMRRLLGVANYATRALRATSAPSTAEMIGSNFFDAAALTLAGPVIRAGIGDDYPIAKNFASQILNVGSRFTILTISHDVFLSQEGCFVVRADAVLPAPIGLR